MEAAMLLEKVWYGVPFGTGNQWPKMCVWGSQAQPLWTLKNTQPTLCIKVSELYELRLANLNVHQHKSMDG